MSYSITNLLSDLEGILHGTTTNQVTNMYGVINRAARQVLADVDPQETKRIAPVAGTVFNGVWDYTVPSDLKGNKVIDLYPQVNRYPSDMWLQAYNQDFDRTKGLPWSSDMFTILFNSSLKTIRINAPFFPAPIVIDDCNAVNGWTGSVGATTPVLDTVNYVGNGGSLKFNLLAGQTTGTLSETLSSPINLSAHLNQSTLFLYTYLPTPSAISSVTLTYGTNSSNYYQVTTSVTQQNTVFQTGWNLLAFPWLGATIVGSPNAASTSYVAVTWNYNGSLQTAVRLDAINSNLGSILNMEYYSKDLFRDSSGAYKETVTSNDDLVNLDTDSYNLLLYKTAVFCAQQTQGVDALEFDNTFFENNYQALLARYQSMYKSEIQLPQANYYKVKKGGWNLWGGRYNA